MTVCIGGLSRQLSDSLPRIVTLIRASRIDLPSSPVKCDSEKQENLASDEESKVIQSSLEAEKCIELEDEKRRLSEQVSELSEKYIKNLINKKNLLYHKTENVIVFLC